MGMILSLFPYISVFGVALFFFWLAERQYVREGKCADCAKRISDGDIWATIAIILLTLFAAFRAESVGVDTGGYPVLYSNYARLYSDFWQFLSNPLIQLNGEPLGGLTVWLCAKLSDTTVPLLFCYQLFTVLPVFLAARVLKDKLPLTMAMAVYLFFFFNNSLNNMRQSVSCALFLLSFAYIIADGKIRPRAILAAILAVLFHKSAVYGIVLLGITAISSKATRKWMKMGLYAIVVLLPLFVTQFSTWLVSSGLVDTHMEYYFNVFVAGGINQDWLVNPFGTYSLTYLVIYSLLVALPCVLRSSFFSQRESLTSGNNSQESLYKFLYSFLTVGYLLYVVLLLSLSTMYGIRFSMFFDFFLILAIPLSCNGNNRVVKKIFTMAILVAVWMIWIAYMGWSASVPYKFASIL